MPGSQYCTTCQVAFPGGQRGKWRGRSRSISERHPGCQPSEVPAAQARLPISSSPRHPIPCALCICYPTNCLHFRGFRKALLLYWHVCVVIHMYHRSVQFLIATQCIIILIILLLYSKFATGGGTTENRGTPAPQPNPNSPKPTRPPTTESPTSKRTFEPLVTLFPSGCIHIHGSCGRWEQIPGTPRVKGTPRKFHWRLIGRLQRSNTTPYPSEAQVWLGALLCVKA